MEKNFQRALRAAAVDLLHRRFGKIDPVTGQGIQEGTRVTFLEGKAKVVCAIKITTGGRISFPRKGTSWGTLDQIDRVLYVRAVPGDASSFEAQMFAQERLLEAFDQNYKHALKVGIAHLPTWLSADHEAGDRFVGSGFGKHALWKEVGKLAPFGEMLPAETCEPKPMEHGAPVSAIRKLTIEEAKCGIAASLGISPDKIEILIRA